MSLWFELGVNAVLLFLTIIGGVYITRVATLPLLRDAIAIAKKRRLTMRQKAEK